MEMKKISFCLFFLICLSFSGFEKVGNAEVVQEEEISAAIATDDVRIGTLFPDEIFARVIIENLQQLGVSVYSMDDHVSVKDLEKITKVTLYGSGSKLQSIQGVEYLKNLQSIAIFSAQLEDYSPIMGLKKLTSINFTGTRISNLDSIIEFIKNNTDRALYITLDDNKISDFSRIDEVSDVINNQMFGRFSAKRQRVSRTTIIKSLPHEVDFQDIVFPKNGKLDSAQFESGSNLSYQKAQFINGKLIIQEAEGKANYLSKNIERTEGKISYGVLTEIIVSENHILPKELETSFEIEAGEVFEPDAPFKNVSDFEWGTGWAGNVTYSLDTDALNLMNNEQRNTPGSYQLQYEMEKEINGISFMVPFIVNIKRNPVTAVPSVQYSTHVQSLGWQNTVEDGELSGTSGKSKRLEAIKIDLLNNKFSGTIKYSTHVQNEGWQSYSQGGQISGTSGRALRLEAIKIELTDNLSEKYDVYYQVHAQNFGWLDWAKNGQEAGTTGFGYRLEAIRIRLVPKGESAPGSTEQPNRHLVKPNIKYRTHVQREGWQTYKQNGETSGTNGKSLRLEGINIQMDNVSKGISGGIEYRTHIQTYGWQGWKTDNQLSGTSGESKRLEAIQIRLYGEIAKHYDVYYRVHAQQFGWMGWTKNGKSAGTSGFGFRLEAIQIKLVKKGGNPPGATSNTFRNGTQKYVDSRGNGRIKGSKQKIYHIPSSQYYDQTTSPVRMFKTEVEAFKAGFKPAK